MILFGDDFDIATVAPGRPAPGDAAADAAREAAREADRRQADATAVRMVAYQQGLTDGMARAATELHAGADRWVALCAARLDAAEREAAALADAAAAHLAGLVCDSLAAVLPELCARHGAAESAALIRAILPGLTAAPQIVMRVHPQDAGTITQLLGEIPAELEGRLAIERAEDVGRGDVQLRWQDGRIARDTRALREGVMDVFRQFGLAHETA